MEGNLTQESAEILAVRGTAPVENGIKVKLPDYVTQVQNKNTCTLTHTYVASYA